MTQEKKCPEGYCREDVNGFCYFCGRDMTSHSPQPQEDWERGFKKYLLDNLRGDLAETEFTATLIIRKVIPLIEQAKKEALREAVEVVEGMKKVTIETNYYEEFKNDKQKWVNLMLAKILLKNYVEGYNEALSDITTKLKENN